MFYSVLVTMTCLGHAIMQMHQISSNHEAEYTIYTQHEAHKCHQMSLNVNIPLRRPVTRVIFSSVDRVDRVPRVRRRLLDADSEQVDAELQLLSRELNDLFLPNASCSHTTDASPTSGWEPREKQAGVVRSVFPRKRL